MFENFDFSWFLTTPVIFTCVGCLLIIIAIIIFLSSLPKKKKDKKVEEDVSLENENVSEIPNVVGSTEPIDFSKTMQPMMDTNENVANTVSPVQPVAVEPVNVASMTANVEPVTVEPQVQVTSEPVTVSQVEQPNVVMPTESQLATNQQPSVNVAPTVEPINIEPQLKPVPQPSVNVAPTVEPINIEPQLEPVPQPNVNVAPTVEPINIEPQLESAAQPEVAPNLAYGGANPAKNITSANQESKKVIYGGADPLLGTGVIPTVNSTNVEMKASEEIENL